MIRHARLCAELGLALQLTNILRDVGQDYVNGGRIYLPKDDMVRFGVAEADIAAQRRSEGFIALMNFEADRAESDHGAAIAPAQDRQSLTAATIMKAIYSRLLSKMRAGGFRVFGRRYSLSRVQKLWMVFRGWLGWM